MTGPMPRRGTAPADVVLDCGHPPSASPGSLASGFAIMPAAPGSPEGERRLCYACADAWQREQLKRPGISRWGAYLAEAKQDPPAEPGTPGARYVITTWTGGILARCTWATRGKVPVFGGRTAERWHWRAVAEDGSVWYGSGSGPGMFTTMCRAKVKAPRKGKGA